MRTARTRLAECTVDELEAQDAYDELYYGLSDGEQDFEYSLRITDAAQTFKASATAPEGTVLQTQGNIDTTNVSDMQQTSTSSTAALLSDTTNQAPVNPISDLRAFRVDTKSTSCRAYHNKPALNRRTRRRLARLVTSTSLQSRASPDDFSSKPILKLPRLTNRPPGCAFLGAKASEIEVSVNGFEDFLRLIFDSGSDITLISERALRALQSAPRIRQGQRINLIQVTGRTTISGYVPLELYFRTAQGPVVITVEAYVVKGMSTPLILGNDFADQYALSLVRREDRTFLQFGNTDREVEVANSISSPFIDEDGHAFRLRVNSTTSQNSTFINRQKSRRTRRRHATNKDIVVATERTIIPPTSSKRIQIQANFRKDVSSLFIEKHFHSNGHPDEIYGIPDTLVDKEQPSLHVTNFSSVPIVVPQGQVLSRSHNPDTWLDKSICNPNAVKSVNLIRSLVKSQTVRSTAEITSKAQRNATGEGEEGEESIEGGPKTAEVPPEDVASSKLLTEVHISPDLTELQQQQIRAVVLSNAQAFGLDGRLGDHPSLVEINLKPGTQPVSLPPYSASPANREVIDEQMDAWIKLGVIEPSASPWGAPVFIVYRNGKARMVIDLRRLNDSVIPDEFPLPKQEDILQALTGAQWLSSLDALAGFTQLTMSPSASEKLAFRTHRGLYQFKRMPFGYRNGPSVFQRVMQGILAPFLWIFALVYIDDIVVYSTTFEDHLIHLDRVLKAIADANITLSPPKCHLAYQSLLLLGQKVTRLGLSTHKEKVDAILQLREPQNVQQLQQFLGMMVYFSSYIPFYAWIAQPLFQLLKKENGWEWNVLHQEAFDLCKQVLTNAPVRGYAIPGKPYRVYTDACDYGLAGILQQVQPIRIADLKGTKLYDKLVRAHAQGEPVPSLVTSVSKEHDDVPTPGPWSEVFDETIVHVERVICYWSRVLKPPERNYSATEREALALKEALIKFQPFLEGERILAITDHAALTWSTTFQNVNRRLLTWGTVFAAYPKLTIIHRAGKVHSNVDPISRLRRRIPPQESPDVTNIIPIPSSTHEDPLYAMYEELGPRFEEKLLTVASHYLDSEMDDWPDLNATTFTVSHPHLISSHDSHHTSSSYNVLVSISPEDLEKWRTGYDNDPAFQSIISDLRKEKHWIHPRHPQYHYSDDGLLYFEDWNGNNRLCVPSSLRVSVMDEVHNCITESAHGGYHRCYNRLAATYYWPRMSRELKSYINSCDICQKAKPRTHSPAGLLQPIPIPSRPFEVVSMDFIPELPTSDGYDNILVIIDKLTKWAIFIPCHTGISDVETARLFFKHVISKYGIPRQVITDRDARWRNEFWNEVCRLMGMKRALTTSYHPQADGQTENLNKTLEIALRAYIGPSRDDWAQFLDALALSYNTTPHSSSNFAPAYLLYGYLPTTSSTLLTSESSYIPRPSSVGGEDTSIIRDEKAQEMVEQFNSERTRAKEALYLAQLAQQRFYNKDRDPVEFSEGDLVVLNPHTLHLLKDEKGRGQKLLMRYDGPFEILRKLSSVTYQLRMPASYGTHPIINIAHLESYQQSPPQFGERPIKRMNRQDFNDLPEEEIEAVIAERWVKRGKRRIQQFKVRWKHFGPDHDEWLSKRQLSNAPEILEDWRLARGHRVKDEAVSRPAAR